MFSFKHIGFFLVEQVKKGSLMLLNGMKMKES